MSLCCWGQLGVMVWTPETAESASFWICYSTSYLFFWHFCWLQWLTGQFGDVWLFIIFVGVSSSELKPFILDWFFFLKFVFCHMTFIRCQFVNTPSLRHEVFALHVQTLRVALCEWLHVTCTGQTYGFCFKIFLWVTKVQKHQQVFSIISIIITLVTWFVLQPGKVTVAHWGYSK